MKIISKWFFVVVVVFMSLMSKAQHEVISPLSYRGNFVGDIATSTKSSGNVTINGQFFYNLDTLELPLFDDF
jgi:hypothetical protein